VFVRGAGFSALSDCAGDVYTTSGDDLGPRLSQQPMQPSILHLPPWPCFPAISSRSTVYLASVCSITVSADRMSTIDTSIPGLIRHCIAYAARHAVVNARRRKMKYCCAQRSQTCEARGCPVRRRSENDMIVRPIYYVAHTARTCEEARANRCRPRACAVVPRSELRVHSKKY
jgi:hypothetical protein